MSVLRPIQDVVLTLKTERDGQAIVARYRPAVALAAERRLGVPAGDPLVLAAGSFLSELIVDLVVDGRSVDVRAPVLGSRRGLRLSTLALLWGPVLSEILEAAATWNDAQTATSPGHVLAAAAALAQSRRPVPGIPTRKQRRQ
jgi:hypothetical protein